MRKIDREKKTLEIMISIYCKEQHKNETICYECEHLLAYALQRLQKCRFGNKKPTCKKCPIHCYAKKEKENIKKVMRYSGPRMLFRHPILILKHYF